MNTFHRNRNWAVLAAATCLAAADTCAAVSGPYEYSISDDQVTITGRVEDITEAVIPASIDGLPVTAIGDAAFTRCFTLQSVIIPETVTRIGDRAFYLCDQLFTVDLPDSVVELGAWAFTYCEYLQFVTIGNGLSSVGYNAFGSCKMLFSIEVAEDNPHLSTLDGILYDKEMTTLLHLPQAKPGTYVVPEGVTTIENPGIAGCGNLTSVYLPSSVTEIGYNTFSYCLNLTSINVAQANSRYSSTAGVLFDKDRTSLLRFPSGLSGSYAIPEGVVTVNDWAFSGNPFLARVNLPASITTLKLEAFSSCYSLEGLYFFGAPPSLESSVFSAANPSLVIYHAEGVAGWEETFGEVPTAPFIPWGSFVVVDSPQGKFVDTGGWMGWLEISRDPWIWCLPTQCWLYIPDTVAESGQGWLYIPNLTIGAPGLWLVMIPDSNWAWSYGLEKWMYVTESGWVYLFS
jgi:hypothetical protein